MKTKEEYYEVVKEIREMLRNPENFQCSCPNLRCEWHGKCRECVAIHRYYKDHLPKCFQQFVNEKIKALAQVGELDVTKKAIAPPEYWDYIKEQDEKANIKV